MQERQQLGQQADQLEAQNKQEQQEIEDQILRQQEQAFEQEADQKIYQRGEALPRTAEGTPDYAHMTPERAYDYLVEDMYNTLPDEDMPDFRDRIATARKFADKQIDTLQKQRDKLEGKRPEPDPSKANPFEKMQQWKQQVQQVSWQLKYWQQIRNEISRNQQANYEHEANTARNTKKIQQVEPQDFRQFVMRALYLGKGMLRWNSTGQGMGKQRGVMDETGYGQGERKALSWLFNEKEGMPLETFAKRMSQEWREYASADNLIPVDGDSRFPDDMEARNEIIDILSSFSSRDDLARQILDDAQRNDPEYQQRRYDEEQEQELAQAQGMTLGQFRQWQQEQARQQQIPQPGHIEPTQPRTTLKEGWQGKAEESRPSAGAGQTQHAFIFQEGAKAFQAAADKVAQENAERQAHRQQTGQQSQPEDTHTVTLEDFKQAYRQAVGEKLYAKDEPHLEHYYRHFVNKARQSDGKEPIYNEQTPTEAATAPDSPAMPQGIPYEKEAPATEAETKKQATLDDPEMKEAQAFASDLGLPVTFTDSDSPIHKQDANGDNETLRRESEAYVFFPKGGGEPRIVVNVDRCKTWDTVYQKILHEGAGHYGLQKLFGEDLDTVLDNIWNAATPDLQQRISTRYGDYKKVYTTDPDTGKTVLDEAATRREAVNEYMSRLAEKTGEFTPQERTFWETIKNYFLRLLRSKGFRLKRLTDDDLRNIIRESRRNLERTEQQRRQADPTAPTDRTQVLRTGEPGAPEPPAGEPATPDGGTDSYSLPKWFNKVKPTGRSFFGNIYTQFRQKAKEAFQFLASRKEGDLKGVYYRKGIGNIDLVWGDEGGGFEHILNKHIGEGKSFANVEEAEKEISNIINNGEIDFENGDRIVLKIDNKLVTIRKNYRKNGKKIADKNWILTAYDELSADSESPIATIQGLAKSATDNSTGKDTQNSPTDQTNPQQSATEQGKILHSLSSFNPIEQVRTNIERRKIERAEQETDTEPTDAQKEAGNYKKGHIRIDGYDLTIEQPKGSVRRGTDASGKQWEQVMRNTYGYIRGTEGVDGDHIDVFLSDDPSHGDVFVVDQVNKDGSFDEHKVMYGFPDVESARKAYLSNYEDGWTGLGAITPVSKEQFKNWIRSSHRKTKPFAEYSSVKTLSVKEEQGTDRYSLPLQPANDPALTPEQNRLLSPESLIKLLNDGDDAEYELYKVFGDPYTDVAAGDRITSYGRFNEQHRKEGLHIDFAPDGSLLNYGLYHDGRREGMHYTFNPQGDRLIEGAFSNGTRVGTHRVFYDTYSQAPRYDLPGLKPEKREQVRDEITYNQQGRPDGEAYSYSSSGKLLERHIFKNGKLLAEWYAPAYLKSVLKSVVSGDEIRIGNMTPHQAWWQLRAYRRNGSAPWIPQGQPGEGQPYKPSETDTADEADKPLHQWNPVQAVKENTQRRQARQLTIDFHEDAPSDLSDPSDPSDLSDPSDPSDLSDPSYNPTATRKGRQMPPSMLTDEELLLRTRTEEGSTDDWNLYNDEYDRRHRQEYADLTDHYRDVIEKTSPTLDDAYDMLATADQHFHYGGYASTERTELLAQRDVLQDYIDRKEAEQAEAEMGTERYSRVEDPAKIQDLESQDYITTYRSMLLIDGNLYPPMASLEEVKGQGRALKEPAKEGWWIMADEHPERAFQKDGKWYITIRKSNGKTLDVAYNPYIHSSDMMMNDQFSEAQDRPELVVVEMHIPVSEVNNPYHADRAHKPTGWSKWNAGVIEKKTEGQRNVMLSRYGKIARIVPVDKVARDIYNRQLKDHPRMNQLPTNCFDPALRTELEKLGVSFIPTDNQGKILDGQNQGRTWTQVYNEETERLKAQQKAEHGTDRYSLPMETPEDKEYSQAVKQGDWEKVDMMLREEARLRGYSPDTSYQGSIAFNGAAPSKNVYFDTREQRKQAFNNGDFEGDYSLGDFAEAGLDNNDLEWQLTHPIQASGRDTATMESIRNINKALKSGKRTIKIYRAVDADIKENAFRNGDWVTPSREYAERHMGLQEWKKGRIIEQEVPFDDLWWNGDDINEWGYDDGRQYAYKNTPNNRKLLEPTYDDNGNIIPLSQRFNPSNGDIRFSKPMEDPQKKSDAAKHVEERLAELNRLEEKEQSLKSNPVGNSADLNSDENYSPGMPGAQSAAPSPAKLNKKIQNAKDLAEKMPDFIKTTEDGKGVTAENFAKTLMKSIGLSEHLNQPSEYIHASTDGENTYTLRVSDHEGNARNIIINGVKTQKGYSIVLKTAKSPDKKFKPNSWAEVEEYVYENPDTERLTNIAKSIFNLLDTGEYVDLAEADGKAVSPTTVTEAGTTLHSLPGGTNTTPDPASTGVSRGIDLSNWDPLASVRQHVTDSRQARAEADQAWTDHRQRREQAIASHTAVKNDPNLTPAQKNRLQNDMIRRVADVRALVSKVREGDRESVKAVTQTVLDLADAVGDGLTRGAVKKLMHAVENATTRRDVKTEVDKAVDAILTQVTREAQRQTEKLLHTKATKLDPNNIRVAGQMDEHGQRSLRQLNELLSPEGQATDLDQLEAELTDKEQNGRELAFSLLSKNYLSKYYKISQKKLT